MKVLNPTFFISLQIFKNSFLNLITGTTCRESSSECDLPEYCSGVKEDCPSNVFKRDTEECQDGQAYCHQGSCHSHTDQCKLLWGPTGKSHEQCYDENTNGSRNGNCGYDLSSKTYSRCRPEDVLCGMLQCRHLSEILEFGVNNLAIFSTGNIVKKDDKDKLITCKRVNVDLGIDSDPGMTPNGAKCGTNKMCFNQKCVDIESLKERRIIPECPDCNGNGVCNSNGNCHCDNGWAPPNCKDPGFGGSVDSGPASDPESEF